MIEIRNFYKYSDRHFSLWLDSIRSQMDTDTRPTGEIFTELLLALELIMDSPYRDRRYDIIRDLLYNWINSMNGEVQDYCMAVTKAQASLLFSADLVVKIFMYEEFTAGEWNVPPSFKLYEIRLWDLAVMVLSKVSTAFLESKIHVVYREWNEAVQDRDRFVSVIQSMQYSELLKDYYNECSPTYKKLANDIIHSGA